ncbi:binding partner of ACD11 1-like isoform X2 [Salvia splendens]|uniref:binding partner of ACD11 1-like isoform X2 n=1 Tax=Salvia splendens TaxID=180675 RepID=UPI001C25953E|nr:binding partner of ACD11 1-like isoform X2 [Salvia splendens]
MYVCLNNELMDHNETIEGELQPTSPSWTIDVSDSDVRTIKVSNVSLHVSERNIFDFFTSSGSIVYIEMQRESEATQVACITFIDSEGAYRAALLNGSKLADHYVSITLIKNYQLPPDAASFTSPPKSSAVKKAEDVVSTVLARGFLLGKDSLKRAKSFDGKHKLTVHALATVASLDRRFGLRKTLSVGTAVVNEMVREMDELFQVSDITKSAYSAVEDTASSAGSVIKGNSYVLTGASWVTNAYIAITKAVEDVGAMTMQKAERVEEEEKRKSLGKEGDAIYSQFINASRYNSSPALPVSSADVSSKHL